MVHECRNQNKFKFKELKKKGSNFFTMNKAAVMKKGVNHATIIKDVPLDV